MTTQISPMLAVNDGKSAIDFYKAAFDAKVLWHLDSGGHIVAGLAVSKSEVRACYRNRTLKAMYQEARRRYLAEHYGRKPSLRAKIGRYM